MRFAKEKLYELRERIRLEMVKDPDISIYQLQDILLPEYGRKFDKNFLAKLKRKVHRERAIRLNYITINDELAKIQDLIHCARPYLVDIVFNDDGRYKPRDIISAFRAVVWGEITLFDAMMNAGVFDRPQLPEKEKPLTPEQEELLKKAIDYATYRADEYTKSVEQNNQ